MTQPAVTACNCTGEPRFFKRLPSVELLKSRFSYDGVEGILLWKYNESLPKYWNTRYAGKPAGYKRKNGYVLVVVNGTKYFAHRLIWEINHGEIPANMEIDHRNHDRSDNRLENLRLATAILNQINRAIRGIGSSKFKGVTWNKQYNKWQAQISFKGKYKNLGRYESEFDAARAYDEAAVSMAGEYAKTNGV